MNSQARPASEALYRFLRRVRPAPLAVALKRLFKVERKVVETAHGAFCVDPVSTLGVAVMERGVHEPAMVNTLERLLRPGDVFVDLGANEGYFSVIASSLVRAEGQVIAIEPQSRLQPILRHNLALNGAHNVTICPVAVSDRAGRATIHLAPDTNPGSTGLVRMTRYRVPVESVEMITLAELLARHEIKEVDLLKVDIEGYEYEAILGSRDLFEQHRVRAVALELHPPQLQARGLDPKEIARFLDACGYRVDRRFSNLVFVAPAGGAQDDVPGTEV